MNHAEEKEKQILAALSKAGRDMDIAEIAKAIGASRFTVSKYVLSLLRQGKIKQTRRIANARLYAVA